VTHILYFVNALNRNNMCFIGCEIGVFLYRFCHIGKRGSRLKFHIYHTAVNAGAEGYGHAEGVFHTRFAFDAYCVTHAHAGTEVGVSKTLGRCCLKKCAHN
jgi:hypothetical protein